ncbi:MAG: ABC transporter permease, partial [Acidimicrobiia bacterium]
MSTLVGTWSLVRLILRLERLRLAIWVAVLALVPVGVANAFIGLYGTEAAREELVASVAASPAITA